MVFFSLHTTEAKNDAAFELLKTRYDNEFLITNVHMNKTFQIESMKKTNSMKKHIDNLSENEMAFTASGIDTKMLKHLV